MTKASDNPYPSVLLVEQGSTPASPSAGDQRLFIKTADHLYYTVNSSGTVTAVGGSGGSNPLLKVISYSGAAGGRYTISATSQTAVDTTNLRATFTAPASGNVLVRLSAFIYMTNFADNMYWGLLEGATGVGGTVAACFEQSAVNTQSSVYVAAAFYVTGISAGSHSYDWSAAVNAGSHYLYANTTEGHATMEVWAAP